MKTLKSLIIPAAVAAVFATVSCTKEDTPSVDPEARISTITLSIEQPTDESATKTQLGSVSEGSYPINWTKSDAHTDAIAVGTTSGSDVVKYALSSVDAQDATKGKFTGTGVSGAVKAFYPYADVVSAAANVYNVNIPAVQTYTSATSFGEDAMPMYAVASSTTELSSMKPLMSVLKITLSGSCKVKRIIISNASEKLSGSATVTYTSESASLAFASTGANDYVELVCPTAVNLSSGNATFHIVVPATTATSQYTVRVVTDETKVMTKKFTPQSVFTAAKIKNLTNILTVAPGTNVQYVEGSYCGNAVTIGSKTWAPVNCGYDASHTYGLLYQWGRKVGGGYDTTEGMQNATAATYTDGYNKNPDDDTFYTQSCSPYDWYTNTSSQLSTWPMTSSVAGYVEGKIANPCPTGWRVPTYDELSELKTKKSSWTTNTVGGVSQTGYWFSGSTPYSEGVSSVFLPAAGFRGYDYGAAYYRGDNGRYWSSSVEDIRARYLSFNNGSASMDGGCSRAFGYPVRCVQE